MIKEKIIEIIKEQLDVEEIDLNAKIEDQEEIDSIELLDFIMTIEEEFNIEFTDEELDKVKTLNDVIKLVEEKK